MTALILFACGIALLSISVAGLRMKPTRRRDTGIPCGFPSPDSQSSCTLTAGHAGWCASGRLEWRGDVWNMDEWADTQAGPTDSLMSATKLDVGPSLLMAQSPQEWVRSNRAWSIWWWVTAVIAVLMGLMAVYSHTTTPAKPACAREWVKATPLNPLCDDSPDKRLSGPELVAKYCVGVGDRRVCNDKTMGVPSEMNP